MNRTSSRAFALRSNSSASSANRARSRRIGALRGARGHQCLQRPAQLQHPELAAHVDRRDGDAASRLDADEMLAREPLQRLADRCAADAEPLREHRFGHQRAGREPAVHDHLLERRVSMLGERQLRSVRAGGGRGSRGGRGALGMSHRDALFLLLQREDRRVAARPVRRHQARPRIVVRPLRALAADDRLVPGREDRVPGVRERVRRGQRVEQQRPAEVGEVLRRVVQRAAVVQRQRARGARQRDGLRRGRASRRRLRAGSPPSAPARRTGVSIGSIRWLFGITCSGPWSMPQSYR